MACWTGSELSELETLLEQDCCAQTPTITFFGVSPPVRSGAANPWRCDDVRSYSASHANLQALRELDSTGESFLRSGSGRSNTGGSSSGASIIDAAALVLSSPVLSPCSLAEAAAAAEHHQRAALFEDEAQRMSDAGSASTASSSGLHHPAATTAAAGQPLQQLQPSAWLGGGRAPSLAAAAPKPARPAHAGPRACSKQQALQPFACQINYFGLPA